MSLHSAIMPCDLTEANGNVEDLPELVKRQQISECRRKASMGVRPACRPGTAGTAGVNLSRSALTRDSSRILVASFQPCGIEPSIAQLPDRVPHGAPAHPCSYRSAVRQSTIYLWRESSPI
jgi:hypothetical protein